MADSDAALAVPEDFADSYGRLVAQAGMLFGTRMYRHYTWLLTLSDHVTHFGLEHHESSDDRLDENSLSDVPLREGVAELLAHEYVHSWNGSTGARRACSVRITSNPWMARCYGCTRA